MKRSWLPAVITIGVILFLFAPLGVLVVNSFNASRFGGEWEGFTWNWYEKLWAAGDVWESLWITLKIAVSASLAAMAGRASGCSRRATGSAWGRRRVCSGPMLLPSSEQAERHCVSF